MNLCRCTLTFFGNSVIGRQGKLSYNVSRSNMKSQMIIGLCLAVFVMLTIIEYSNAEESIEQEILQERGYCAEKGIKCNDIHCCSGLTCKCNANRSNCVCRKK